MTRRSRVLVSLATVAAALAVTVGAGALTGSAAAASIPLPSDPAAKGYIGLCNQAGQNVTGGSIDTKPFVWKAVSSSRPPSSYQGRGQNAVLGILQPRQQSEPVEWGGTSLTAASYYASRTAPTAQATYADQSLRSVIKDYPPQVDGLYVLRMYFGKSGYGDYSTTYPTTTIQVTGSSWRVVRGGTVDCHAASAVSDEQLTGVAGKQATTPRKPSSSDHTVQSARSRVITAPARTVGSSGSGSGSGSGSTAAHGTQSLNASTTADSTSSSWVVWLLVGLVAVLAAALIVSARGRRSRKSD